MSDLNRFKQAQDDPVDGYQTALAEMQAGRKRRHWIWYVFPQLAGLGLSLESVRYGIADKNEAIAYLHDPLLRNRLVTISTVVESHLKKSTDLRTLMGSHVDVLKLVSSMTLWSHVAGELADRELEDLSARILSAAAAQGFPPCAYTLAQLAL